MKRYQWQKSLLVLGIAASLAGCGGDSGHTELLNFATTTNSSQAKAGAEVEYQSNISLNLSRRAKPQAAFNSLIFAFIPFVGIGSFNL